MSNDKPNHSSTGNQRAQEQAKAPSQNVPNNLQFQIPQHLAQLLIHQAQYPTRVSGLRRPQTNPPHPGSSWSGPLPNPKDAKAYEDIKPESFDRILVTYEKQTATNCKVAKKDAENRSIATREMYANQRLTIETNKAQETRGQNYALILGILDLGATLFCAYINQPWVAGALVGFPVMGFLGAFLWRNQSNSLPIKANNFIQETNIPKSD